MKRLAAALLLALPARVAAADAGAPASIEAGRVRVETNVGAVWIDDCPALDALRWAERLYIACGEDGVLEYELGASGPRQVARRASPGRAIALFVHGGAVWVEVERREAHPLTAVQLDAPLSATASVARPRPAPVGGRATRPAQAAPAGPRTGTVTRVDDLDVYIDLGVADGLQTGDRVEILDGERTLVVGRVERADEREALIGVGLGERVPQGASARRADRAPVTRSLVAPPRQGGLLELVAELQLFLPISTLGLGTLTSLSAAYRFVAPVVLQAHVKPLGLSGSDRGNIFSIASWAAVGLDTHLFEFTLGAGGATVNDRDFGSLAKGAFTLVPAIRVGARDGLNLAVESGTQVYDDGFQFGFLHVSGQIPVSTRVSLRLRGGGGRVGHAFGDLGVRYLLTGHGGRDSVFLLGSLGGAWTRFEGRCTVIEPSCSQTELAGPSLGVGLEWRP